tara:strand:+ start:1368 stop:1529 length:162 start_codon:yes stop_codon:yes gene_type:complete
LNARTVLKALDETGRLVDCLNAFFAKNWWKEGESWQTDNDVQNIEHDGRFDGS